MIENDKYYFLEGNVPHVTILKDDKYLYVKSLINNLIMDNVIF